MILNAALGDGKTTGAPPKLGDKGVKDLAAGHTSVEAAVEAINAAMTIG
jgi:hypothetical protein